MSAAVAGAMSAPALAPPAWRPRTNPWIIALIATMATFMEVLDTTIVNVALPHIAGSLSVDTDESAWTLSSYLVANGIVLPISGWLSRVFGRKNFFMLCIGMFTLCSLMCGLATSLWQLILFRVLQGFFGGGMQPTQQSIMLDTFEPSQRGTAFAFTTIATIFGPVLGPTVGGFVTDNFTWRWVFLMNVPVGILVCLAIWSLLEDPPWAKRVRGLSFDYVGLGLIALGLGSLEIVLDRGQIDDWFDSDFIRLFTTFAVIGIVGAVGWLLYSDKPVVNLRVFANRNFAIASLLMWGMMGTILGSVLIVPQFVQLHLGYTATWAGLVLSPGSLMMIVMVILSNRISLWVDSRYLIVIGFTIAGYSRLLAAQSFSQYIDYNSILWIQVLQYIGIGMVAVPVGISAFSAIPNQLNADASSLFSMMRNIAGSVGIAVVAMLVTRHSQEHLNVLAAHMTPLEQPYVQAVAQRTQAALNSGVAPVDAARTAVASIYADMQEQASAMSFLDAFKAIALLGFVVAPLGLLLRRPNRNAAPAGVH